ncbi:MAG: hypothetical protein LQ345_004804, partial [Seirophora villosa]
MVARHGLSEVHALPEGKDTIALSDDGEETRTQPGSSVFWPRDLLPNELRDVRIFTWGYDADIDGFGSASQNTIHQHAGSLLSDIADQRETSKHYKKPIIFVVHSLGGIIVKAALNKSSAIQGTRLKDIAPATFGVCFLGTPHRGSTGASLGKIAFEITKAATRRPNTRLLQGLERKSETLDQVGDTEVVDADSAKIGDGHEEVGSIPANHSRMTKFDDCEDIGFKRVTAQLRRWTQEIRGHTDISPADIDGKPGSGKSTLMKFAMKDPRTIALLGNDSGPHWTIAAFFFHDRGSTVQKSLVGMLREIIESIFTQIPDLMPHAIALYKDLSKSQRTRFPDWNLEALTALMKTIMGQRETRIKLLLFIDALDEHEGDHDLLVHILNECISNADDYYVTLKICLASRSWPVFTDYFGRGPNFAIDQFTEDDIRLYTESRLNGSLVGPSQPPGLENVCLADLIEQITTKAQGVFIWVRLVTDQLAKNIRDGTPYQTLRAMVAGMPEELQELYDHTIRRISPEYIPETHVMFQLVLCSIERLPLDSLMQATEYSLSRCLNGTTPAATTDPSSHTSTQGLRWLKSRAGGLLETYSASIDGSSDSGAHTDYVQFLHQTAKEYIQESRAQATMELWAYSVAKKNGFYFLALASQSYFAWVAPIKVHMLYYAKMTEMDKQIDGRINLPIDQLGGETEKLPCGTEWWLAQQKGRSGELLHLVASIDSKDYRLLSIAVAANLLFMVDSQRIDRSRLDFDENGSSPCLLQIAIGGPDVVPARLQDRTAMVAKLLSTFGYPPDRRNVIPPVLTAVVKYSSEPEVKETQRLCSE